MRGCKHILLILVFCLIIAVLPLKAAAFNIADTESVIYMEPRLYSADGGAARGGQGLDAFVDIRDLRELLLRNISECNTYIDIAELNIPQSAYTLVGNYIFYYLPEAFNVRSLKFSVLSSNLVQINMIYEDYADTKEEYTRMYGEFLASADALLNGIEGNGKLTDVQKALLLHDRLALLTEYSYKDYSKIKHTAYSAFVQRSSVCQGYTMAYMYLLDRVGIKSTYCSSDALNHVWNIVYIDSVAYHVDVTWDDVSWAVGERGALGAVRHTNFLRSTNGIVAEKHNASDFDSSPVDTRYDNAFWQSSETAFQLVDNDIYYIDNNAGQIKKYGENKALCSVEAVWELSAFQHWNGNYSKLSSYGADLIYSLADGVYKYNISENKSTKIYSPGLSSYMSVFGMAYENGYIICDVNNAPPMGGITKLKQVSSAYSDFTASVAGVKVVALPSKTEYYIGDELALQGISVKVMHTDDTSEIINEGFDISGFSSEKEGAVTVRVVYKGFSDTFSVSVLSPKLIFSRAKQVLTAGHTADFDVVCEPAGQSIVWKSKNTEIACVSSEGVVQALREGRTAIIAGFTYNGNEYTALYEIEILPAVLFNDSSFAKLQGDNILMTEGITAERLLAQTGGGAVIKDSKGRILASDDIVGTGMTLVFRGGDTHTTVVYGDTDGDGLVTASDARLTLRASVKLEKFNTGTPEYIAANVDGKAITASDARLILRASVKLESAKDWLK